MALSDLASAMGEVVGLTKEDVMPMFLQSGRMEEVSVTIRTKYRPISYLGTAL